MIGRRTCGTRCSSAETALGQVPSTGEYKVLRVLEHFNDHDGQLYEVCTVNRGSNAWWRGKKPVPRTVRLGLWLTVVVNGIVYFFYDEQDRAQDPALDGIASFDLGIEEWRASLRGPLSSIVNAAVWHNFAYELTMAALNGCLVVVHQRTVSSMNLWFLMDFERGLWVKQHNILVPSIVWHALPPHPLLVLNDGRIVIFYIGHGNGSIIRVYNPTNNTSTAEMGYCCAVGLYTGSPLGQLVRLVLQLFMFNI